MRVSLVSVLLSISVLFSAGFAGEKCCGKKEVCKTDPNKCPQTKSCCSTDSACKAKSDCKADPNKCSQSKACCSKDSACKAVAKKACDVNNVSVCQSSKCLAKVNGTEINEQQVMDMINPVLERQLQYMPEEQREQQKGAMVERMKTQVIESLVIQTLLDQQVADNNIVITDANVESEIAKIAKQQNMSADDFANVLKEQGRDIKDVKKQIKQGMGYEQYFDKLAAKEIGEPNDAEVKAYYEQNAQQFSQPEMVQASHILFGINQAPEGTDPNTYKADQLAKAKEVLAKIKDGGDFAALAKEYSSCPSKDKGGDLGSFQKGRMVPEFEKAAFENIKPGNVGDDIVETQFGYHIIKVTEHTDAKTMSFDEVKDKIAEQLGGMKKQEFAKKHIDSLKQNAKIEYPMDVKPADVNAVK